MISVHCFKKTAEQGGMSQAVPLGTASSGREFIRLDGVNFFSKTAGNSSSRYSGVLRRLNGHGLSAG